MNKLVLVLGSLLSLSALFTTNSAFAEDGFSIKNVKSRSGFTTIFIETDKARRLNCAVFDSNDFPLQYGSMDIRPNLGKVVIITGKITDKIASTKCWEITV